MTRPHPLLTFAVPYYGERDYLPAALDSVLAQTEERWRCVVVDNAPEEDGAREVVDAVRDDRVAYARNPRSLPMAENWNRCLELADTELVTLLHADDALLPCYAREMIGAAGRHAEAVALFCRARTIDHDGRYVTSVRGVYKRILTPEPEEGAGVVLLRGEDGARALLRGNFIVAPTLCFRRELLDGRGFTGRWRFMADIDFTLRLVLDGETLVGLPTDCLLYRLHGGSQTSELNRTLYRFEEEAAFLAGMEEPARERGWHRAAATARRMGVTKLHLAFEATANLLRLRWGAARAEASLLARLFLEGAPRVD